MATINSHRAKDGSLTYRVRVRGKGHPLQTASFPTLKDARHWATMIEGEMLAGKHFPVKQRPHTLTELLQRYRTDVMPRKTAATQSSQGPVLAYWQQRLGPKLLGEITKADIVAAREDLRQRGAAPATLHKYLTLLSHAFNTAMREYEWLDHNIVTTVSRPPLPPGQVRFLSDEERTRLLEACRSSRNSHLYDLVVLALYTGLRRGSLFALRRRSIDLSARTLSLETTKNKSRLVLPIVGEAYTLLLKRCEGLAASEYLFPGKREQEQPGFYRRAFEQAVLRAGIPNFTFHSLRHCVGSYLVQCGVPIYTVSQILAHTRISSTQRYSHLGVEHLRDALEIMAERFGQ